MKRAVIIVIVLFILGASGYAAYQYVQTNPAVVDQTLTQLGLSSASGEKTGLVASGTIEATHISVASDAGGRIDALHVAEGDQVIAGQLIAEMDTTLLDTQIEQARAAKKTAEAQVALLEAGAREADVAVARAAVTQAETTSDAAYVAWQDALALVDAPGELDVQIAQAEAQVQAAQDQLTAAQASAAAADLEQQLWGRIVKSLEAGIDVPLPNPGGGTIHVEAPADKRNTALMQWNLASQKTWEAHAKANSAAASLDAAQQALADLRKQKADPQALQAQAAAAESAYQVAQAAVAVAQANVDIILAGVPKEQIEAARALVDQADGAIQSLRVKRAQAQITAPQAGRVTAVVLRTGEVAAPGAPIVRLADLGKVTLTVYVPEPDLGQVQLGGTVGVTVDSFPGRTFQGTVSHIADRAEFTPKNVQTKEERVNTVFAVKITLLENPDGALKPGMPADAHFGSIGTRSAEVTSPAGAPADQGKILASGTIEATETTISAELGGRVVEVDAAEGDQVSAGQTLVQLDASELTAKRSEAEAAVVAAQADLAQVTAPPQAAKIAQAEAQVQQAQAALAAAQTALGNAQKLRDNPLDLDAQINSARAQVKSAAAQVDEARAQLKAAQVLQESLPNPGSDEDRTRRAMYDQNVAAAEAMVRAAEAGQQGAQAVLAQLLAIRENPVALEAAVHQAEGQVAQAEAGVKVAQAALAQVKAPAQPEAVALAQAKVAQAKAALASLDATIEKLTITSPVTGTVTVQAIRKGEIAQPGVPLFTVVNLRQVKLVIYVPTGRIGQVRLGQPAQVSVDAYPGRTFTGTVTHIADQAEFTPKNVQTQEERVKTVFAVEITLENEDGALKPGMPADAALEE